MIRDDAFTAVRGRRMGVALGGGSARGFAHIGVLASLEGGGLCPDVVVGTSFGAVIGALYVMGRRPDELAAEARAIRTREVLPRIADAGVRRGALLAGDRLEAYFDRLVEGRHFADVPRPFAVVATDLATGEKVLLREGSIAAALRASTALPGVFAPARHEGRLLVDGGLGDPVPLDALGAYDVDVALGVAVGRAPRDSGALRALRGALATPAGRRASEALRSRCEAGALGALAGAMALTAEAWATERRADTAPARLHVDTRPPISWLGFDRAAAAIAAGHAAMEAAWPQLRWALGQPRPAAAP